MWNPMPSCLHKPSKPMQYQIVEENHFPVSKLLPLTILTGYSSGAPPPKMVFESQFGRLTIHAKRLLNAVTLLLP